MYLLTCEHGVIVLSLTNKQLPLVWVLPAPAKVNLHLWVTGVLADGRHTLDTSFAYVALYDTVHVEPASVLCVRCSTPSLNGENNLVYRVLDALRQRYDVSDGLDVYIDKKIPAEAGLGGGSSDAATAIMAACRLWHIHASMAELIAFATPWGADIPCFLFAQSSRASGVGECLQPLHQALPEGIICLARPGGGVSTGAVFQAFDQDCVLTQEVPLVSVRAASQQGLPIGENMLQASAERLLPALSVLLRRMREHSDYVWMSGSGSSCIALCANQESAQQLVNDVTEHALADWTWCTRWLNHHPLRYWMNNNHQHRPNNGA
ncbi:MAG: 4-(cytidine 5'-diphospho)-2-C-methyl-D-erythritol kinase [Mariprofundaceae bacterium]|nr:4-(cytidine 5'-diphospho)-2-C-methyl-D-erythritol kinase [Mariprofundaceae bacterium]